MVTQDFTLAKLAILTWRYLYLLKMRIYNFFKPLLTWVITKSVLPLVTSPTFPTTWSSWALYKDQGMNTIHKLHHWLHISGSRLLVQHSLHWATSNFDSLVKCALSHCLTLQVGCQTKHRVVWLFIVYTTTTHENLRRCTADNCDCDNWPAKHSNRSSGNPLRLYRAKH